MRITRTLTVGLDAGATWYANAPSDSSIDQDNEGVMSPAPRFMIDLSEVASLILGRQCPLMGEVKLHSLRFGIRHVNNLFDNDDSAAFAGTVNWYPPTEHNQEALKLAREVEKARETYQVDADSVLLSPDTDYSGFRYGLTDSSQVVFNTQSDIVLIDYNMVEIFDIYNEMTIVPESNALFRGRASNMSCSKMFAVAANSGQDTTNTTEFVDDTIVLNHRALPIVFGSITHSGTDEENSILNPDDDDYTFEVEVDFTVGGGF